jgi:hypothetical protein
MTAENDRSRFRAPSGGPILREAPLGTKLILKDGSLVEIIGNPGDGGWVNVRYLESATGTTAVGEEEWVFVVDVKDFAEEV